MKKTFLELSTKTLKNNPASSPILLKPTFIKLAGRIPQQCFEDCLTPPKIIHVELPLIKPTNI